MFKGHPKGLYVAFFSNMGERFGFYTMFAIFNFYIQAKFGFDSATTGIIFGGFLFAVYFLPLIGGIIADNWLGYGKTILIGQIIMFLGYGLLALPTMGASGLWLVLAALFTISLGTGFFKGNLQALVGNMYDDPKYGNIRDSAFNIFYMGINIGAFFAPTAAEAISNWFLGKNGFFYNPNIPHLAHKFLDGTLENTTEFANLAVAQGADPSNLAAFSENYINALSHSYNYGFAIAAISMVISLAIFVIFKKYYKDADFTEKQKAKDETRRSEVVELSPEQTRERLIALGLVFFVVIFFWMSFHQNGFTLSFFARDYTAGKVSAFTNLFFELKTFLPIIAAMMGIVFIFSKNKSFMKIIGAIMLVGGAGLTYYFYHGYDEMNPITPQKFQHFNPIFIVFLTPVVVGLFGWLRKKGKEPSSPKKIGIGMIITAIGFIIMVFASLKLSSPKELDGGVSNVLVSPYWLISTYFTLTIAELFLSPMGISFVSKVSPPKYKGLMQGGWLAATSIGNLLVGIMGFPYNNVQLWFFWSILVICCLLSATFIFSVLKRLERSTNGS